MSTGWYVYQNGQQRGPFTREQIQDQTRSGAIQPGDQVWNQSLGGWTRADRVAGLFQQPAPPPPQAPPPPFASAGRQAPPPPAAPGPGIYNQGVQAQQRGKGTMIAMVVLLVLLLVGGAVGLTYYFLQSDSGASSGQPAETASNAEDPPPPVRDDKPTVENILSVLIGSWKGESRQSVYGHDFTEVYYFQFSTEGTFYWAMGVYYDDFESFTLEFLLDEEEIEKYESGNRGIWFFEDYRLTEERSKFYLERHNQIFEEWDVFFEIEFKDNNTLILYEPYSLYESQEIVRISDHELEEIINLWTPAIDMDWF